MANQLEPQRSYKRPKQNINQTNLAFDPDKQHPLLNDLILENIFCYWKGKINELAPYRVVCQTWNREIVKLQRTETQIDLAKIVSPYPVGMGWTSSPTNLETPFYYEIPYPEVRPFENISVTAILCQNLRKEKWVSWFQVMGGQVKHLKFSSPFACPCQNQFLERILKEWCPNLESLDIRNVKGLYSMLLVSSFLQNSKDLACTRLKDLRISVVGEEFTYTCKSNTLFINVYEKMETKMLIALSTCKLIRYIYLHGLNPSRVKRFPKTRNMEGKKITLKVPPFENQNIPDLSPYFLDSLQPTDGGIIGQIMKQINLEKLAIYGFDDLYKCINLSMFFHIRPNKFRTSLKHLELDNFLVISIRELLVIGQVRFPLRVIKLGGIHLNEDNAEMTRFLNYFVETLEHLEISGRCVLEEERKTPSELILPILPKLKTFVQENIVACRLTAANIWKNAPNLKTCHLRGSSGGWDANGFFKNVSGILSASMRDLILVSPLSGKQAEMILSWFPNLVQMEVVLKMLGEDANLFFENLGKSKVEQLKFGFLGHDFSKKDATVPWKEGSFGGLKSLEIQNLSGSSFPLTEKPFTNGQLTSLKLHGFQILENEKELIGKRIPSFVVVNMS